MQSINVAYKMLQGNIGKESDQRNYDDLSRKYNDTAVIVRDDLVKNLDLKAYTDYFESVFNEPFTSSVEKIYPTDKEADEMSNGFRTRSIYNTYYSTKFSNKDNTKVFNLDLSVYITDLMKSSKGLGGSNTTYPMGVSTHAYIDSRRVKISSRDYTHSNKKSVFTKPETVFPKPKIVKKNKKVIFKKASMLSALKSEIQAENTGDYYMIPTADENKFIGIYRTTMMRQGIWNIQGIYEYTGTRYKKTNEKMKFISFMENEEFLTILRQVKMSSLKDATRLLDYEYKRLLAKG